MVNSLILSGLLLFGVSGAAISPSYTLNVSGIYNYRESFEGLVDLFDSEGQFNFTLTFDSTNQKHNCPLYFNDDNEIEYYISDLNMNLFSPYGGIVLCAVTYNVYDIFGNTDSYTISISSSVLLDNVGYPATMFYSINSYLLQGRNAVLFSLIFTKEDNHLVRTYNGYYNFVANSGILPFIEVYGSIVFNDRLWLTMSNSNMDGESHGGAKLQLLYYDVFNYRYDFQEYYYPLSASELSVSTNLLLNNCKMSVTTYERLSNIGVFSYVNTQTSDTTFKDMIFSIMDAPIYMITRLLSFELFGINLFAALTGLLTIVALFVLIRKVV